MIAHFYERGGVKRKASYDSGTFDSSFDSSGLFVNLLLSKFDVLQIKDKNTFSSRRAIHSQPNFRHCLYYCSFIAQRRTVTLELFSSNATCIGNRDEVM